MAIELDQSEPGNRATAMTMELEQLEPVLSDGKDQESERSGARKRNDGQSHEIERQPWPGDGTRVIAGNGTTVMARK
jgi:hypothetical protein